MLLTFCCVEIEHRKLVSRLLILMLGADVLPVHTTIVNSTDNLAPDLVGLFCAATLGPVLITTAKQCRQRPPDVQRVRPRLPEQTFHRCTNKPPGYQLLAHPVPSTVFSQLALGRTRLFYALNQPLHDCMVIHHHHCGFSETLAFPVLYRECGIA